MRGVLLPGLMNMRAGMSRAIMQLSRKAMA